MSLARFRVRGLRTIKGRGSTCDEIQPRHRNARIYKRGADSCRGAFPCSGTYVRNKYRISSCTRRAFRSARHLGHRGTYGPGSVGFGEGVGAYRASCSFGVPCIGNRTCDPTAVLTKEHTKACALQTFFVRSRSITAVIEKLICDSFCFRHKLLTIILLLRFNSLGN